MVESFLKQPHMFLGEMQLMFPSVASRNTNVDAPKASTKHDSQGLRSLGVIGNNW